MARTFALVPLRGGSKSIPDKNIRLMAGKPMAQWAIEAAKGCKAIDKVFVATDSEKIRQRLSHLVDDRMEIINRSPESATDTASTEFIMKEFSDRYPSDFLTLIQATSPMLSSLDLDQAFAKFQTNKLDSLLSVVRQKRFFWREDLSGATPLNYSPEKRPRRQDFEGQLVENGAFYITSPAQFKKSGSRLSGRIGLHEMCEESYIEIDEPFDFDVVERFLLKKRATSIGWKDIKVVFTDVDGVLTDSGMYYSDAGDAMKKFNTRDGKAVDLLRSAGIRTVIVTGENSPIVIARAKKLRIEDVFIGVQDKKTCVSEYLRTSGIPAEHALYVGDDLIDLGAIEVTKFSACPSDAVSEVQRVVGHICHSKGGDGVLREIAGLLT